MVVLPDADSFGEVTTLDSGISYCIATDKDGKQAGYVFTAGAKGYGGTVSVMVGMDNEGVITGIEILSHSETPGLGMNATTPEFKGQYADKLVDSFVVNKAGASADNEISAISGATITSNAVTDAVNAAIEYFKNVLG